jgi:hypothetical protein
VKTLRALPPEVAWDFVEDLATRHGSRRPRAKTDIGQYAGTLLAQGFRCHELEPILDELSRLTADGQRAEQPIAKQSRWSRLVCWLRR